MQVFRVSSPSGGDSSVDLEAGSRWEVVAGPPSPRPSGRSACSFPQTLSDQGAWLPRPAIWRILEASSGRSAVPNFRLGAPLVGWLEKPLRPFPLDASMRDVRDLLAVARFRRTRASAGPSLRRLPPGHPNRRGEPVFLPAARVGDRRAHQRRAQPAVRSADQHQIPTRAGRVACSPDRQQPSRPPFCDSVPGRPKGHVCVLRAKATSAPCAPGQQAGLRWHALDVAAAQRPRSRTCHTLAGTATPQWRQRVAASGRSPERHSGQDLLGAGSPNTERPRRAE
jgi:hypothetical protein